MMRFNEWRRKDSVFAQQVEKVSGQTALRLLKKIEAQGKENFSACAWLLERRFSGSFSQPKTQLNLAIQNNVTKNNLTVTVTNVEASAIEAQATPIREEVRKMYERYRPSELGNGEKVRPIVEESVPQAAEPAQSSVITHKDGDEKRKEFWRALVNAHPENFVARETAVFVVRSILMPLTGYKRRLLEIDFANHPTTVEDLFTRLEQLAGPVGWQLAHKLGGYIAPR
jgi:hypothetical protein